jgi:hypothetical protein
MDTAKRQKIHNAICTAIAYATKGFLTIMAAAFALMFVVCLFQVFQEPIISLIGSGAFGAGAWMLWETRNAVQIR